VLSCEFLTTHRNGYGIVSAARAKTAKIAIVTHRPQFLPAKRDFGSSPRSTHAREAFARQKFQWPISKSPENQRSHYFPKPWRLK
jgi:hypothetical protein